MSIQDAVSAQLPLAVKGDKAAIAALLTAVQAFVVRYCRARLGRRDSRYATADDVAQDVQVALLTALPRFAGNHEMFLPFVYSIAQHKVADAQRCSIRDESAPWSNPPETPSTQTGPAEWCEQIAFSERLHRLLDSLTTAQREVLILRVAVGLSFTETASITGATPCAVRLTQQRAMLRLRGELQTNKNGPPHPLNT